MEYEELKTGIRDHLNNAAEDFFMIGYFLRQVSERTLFIQDGYKSIWEFAKGEYGLSTSSASRFMAINARFSIDGGEHMDQKYIGMGPSKLQEMLGLSYEDLEKVTKETTVRELRAMKAAKLSFFKLPKTERPEGSLLTTPGCGNGKHDCFSCCHPCNIRQEDRFCRGASTMAEKKPCQHTTEEFLKDVEAGMYKDECQFLHLELAKVRLGDNEPIPCCLDCKYKGLCFSSCDVAKKKYQEEVKENQKRLQAEKKKKEKEAEEKRKREEAARREAAEKAAAEAAKKAEADALKKQEPSEEDLKKLFEYWDLDTTQDPEHDLDPNELKHCHNYEGIRSGDFTLECQPNGVTINGKKRLTWLKLSKALTEVFNSVQPEDSKPEESHEGKETDQEKPAVIDAEFREVVDEPKDDTAKEAETAKEEREEAEDQQEASKIEIKVQETEIEEPDPEDYDIDDVIELLRKNEADLEAVKSCGLKKPVKRLRIVTDALRLLVEKKEAAAID